MVQLCPDETYETSSTQDDLPRTCCCDWLVDMYFDHFEPWCRNAYMDLALNGQPFVKSALHASLVNAEFMTTVTPAEEGCQVV